MAILLLALAYAGLTLLFASPLGGYLMTHTAAGSHSGDQCQTIWFFWWTKLAVFETGQTPFWTDMIYYPHGTGVGYQIALLTDFMAIGLASLLGVAVNAPIIFNLLLLLAFILTGLAAFLLIRELSGSWAGAFVGSLFITFSPYRLWHLEHLNLLSMAWAIFAVMFALRFFRRSALLDLALAVVAITLSFYTAFSTTALAVFLITCWLAFELGSLGRRSDRGRVAWGGLAGIVITVVLCFPGLMPLLEYSPDWRIGWEGSEPFGAGLSELVLPHWTERAVGPGEAFLGWVLLGLCLFVIIACRRDKTVRRWGYTALIFLVLSLGPSLRVGDSLYLQGLMPYRWLYEILPFLRLGRTPARFIMPANLAMSVIVAIGIRDWLRLIGAGKSRAIGRAAPVAICAVVAAGIYLESADTPINLAPMETPAVYQEVAADTSIHVICDLPMLDKVQISNWYMYWQTTHGKKTVNGFLTRHSPEARTLVDQLQGLDSLAGVGLDLLHDAGVDALVLHEPGRESRLARLERPRVLPNGSDTLRAP